MSDSVGSQFMWAVGCLENEQAVLAKLLYRNNNQHGRTKLFTHLKAINNNLKLLTNSKIKEINKNTESCIRTANQSKISQLNFSEISLNTHKLYDSLIVIIECVSWGAKSSQCLIKLLSMKIFVPLYTLLLALIARTFNCCLIISLHFELRLKTIHDQLKHIGLIDAKFSNQVSLVIQATTLPTSACDLLADMRSALDSSVSLDSMKRDKETAVASKKTPNSSSDSALIKRAASLGSLPSEVAVDSEDTGDIIATLTTSSSSMHKSKSMSSAPIKLLPFKNSCNFLPNVTSLPIASNTADCDSGSENDVGLNFDESPVKPSVHRSDNQHRFSNIGEKRAVAVADPEPTMTVASSVVVSESVVDSGAGSKKTKNKKKRQKRSAESVADELDPLHYGMAVNDIDDIFGDRK